MSKTKIELVSDRCVNSRWPARWLAADGQECCQCMVGCKVKLSVAKNGHSHVEVVVTEAEYKQLTTQTTRKGGGER